jgi:hypothetical protein
MKKILNRLLGNSENGELPIRRPIIGRKRNELDQLALYHHVFGNITDGHSDARIEIQVATKPGDEIAEVEVIIPGELLCTANEAQPLMTISTDRHGGVKHPIEITRLELLQGSGELHHERDSEAVRIYLRERPTRVTRLKISFAAWELVEPLEGIYPYVHASLRVQFAFPAIEDAKAIVTIVTPADSTPRSTQGNYSLAYPSRTFAGERFLNLYYSSADNIRIRYRFGPTEGLVKPWLNLGQAAVSAAFVCFVDAFAGVMDESDRLLAVIASFVAVAAVVWDLIQEVARFSIYGRTRRLIYFAVLGAQILVVAVLGLSLVGLRSTESQELLRAATVASGVLSLLLGIAAASGFFLHFKGWWHGFMCDHEGCNFVFRIRRERPECRYTGRVMCDRHIQSICGACPHGPDLLTGELSTVDSFDSKTIRCVQSSEYPPDTAPQAAD